MNYAAFFLKFLALLPGIAAQIENSHQSSPVETKTSLAAESLGIATTVATAFLPAGDAQIAAIAGGAAQTVLGSIVTALHTANNPAPVATS
jgi:hypothetical protein